MLRPNQHISSSMTGITLPCHVLIFKLGRPLEWNLMETKRGECLLKLSESAVSPNLIWWGQTQSVAGPSHMDRASGYRVVHSPPLRSSPHRVVQVRTSRDCEFRVQYLSDIVSLLVLWIFQMIICTVQMWMAGRLPQSARMRLLCLVIDVMNILHNC